MTTVNVTLTPNVDTDQSASLQAQVDAAPNGIAGDPTIINLPSGRYRIDYGLQLTSRSHLRITVPGATQFYPAAPDWDAVFTAYTDKVATDLGLPGGRSHYRMAACTDVVCSFLAIDGPWTNRDAAKPLFALWSSVHSNDHAFTITSGGAGGSVHCVDCGWEDCYAINIAADCYCITGGNYLGSEGNASVRSVVRRCQGYYGSRHGITASNSEFLEMTDVYTDWNGYGGMDIEPNLDMAHCWDATFTRVSVGGKIGPAFQGAGSNSNTTFARKKNLRFTDCVALHGSPATIHISGGGASSMNLGYCIIEGFDGHLNSDIIGITAAGFDDVVIDGCTVTTTTYTNQSSAFQGSERQSLTITNNVFNGKPGTEGFDVLVSAATVLPSTYIHYGNVWAMGTQSDGNGNVATGSAAQTLPALSQSVAANVGALPATATSGGFSAILGSAEAMLGGIVLGAANLGVNAFGTVASSFPSLDTDATLAVEDPSAISQALPAITTQAAVGIAVHGSVVGATPQTLPVLTQSLAGVLEAVGTIASDLPQFTQAFDTAIIPQGDIDQTLPALTQLARMQLVRWPEWVASDGSEWGLSTGEEWAASDAEEWLVRS